MAEKKQKKRWKVKIPLVCRQSNSLRPVEDPYDLLPGNNPHVDPSVADSGITDNYNTSNSSSHGNQPSDNPRDTDTPDHSRAHSAASNMDMQASGYQNQTTDEPILVVMHSESESETIGNSQRALLAVGGGDVGPTLHEREGRDSDQPQNINVQANTNNVFSKPHLPPLREQYITLRIPQSKLRHGYINVDQYLYPHLTARADSLRGENDYAVLNEDSPCLHQAPPAESSMGGESDHPPAAHRVHGSGYLSVSRNYRPNYLTKTRQTLIEPPNNITEFLCNLKQQREFGAVTIDSRAATIPLFNTSESEISRDALVVSVPENGVSEPKELLFVKSTNSQDFPPSVHCKNICSDVIHMLPHGATFLEPLLVRIPLYPTANTQQLTVMYSDSDSGHSNPIWHVLETPNTYNNHGNEKQAPVWFFKNSFLFLYVTHFCMFVVVDGKSGQVKSYNPLRVRLKLEYKPRLKGISATVTFRDQLQAQDTAEEGVEEACFMLCDNSEHVTVQLTADDCWNFIGRGTKQQEVSYVQLKNIEQLSSSPRISFNLHYNEAHDDLPVSVCLTVRQPGGDIPTNIDSFFTLAEITRSGRPAVEGCEGQSRKSLSSSQTMSSPSNTMTPQVKPMATHSSIAPQQEACPDSTKPSIGPLRLDPQEHADSTHSVSTAAIPYVRERYLPFHYNPMTEKGVLMPDVRVQDELARILDRTGEWEEIAAELNMPVHRLAHANSPMKYIIRAHALSGRMCNWFAFSDVIERQSPQAAEVLKRWYSEQTIPKQRI